MYWSGDLGYLDADGFAYYAGRTGDWLRVDGENLAAAPVERILLRHPDVSRVAVYAVPDAASATSWWPRWCCTTTPPSTPTAFEKFLAAQADLGPKQWPRYVRIADRAPPDRHQQGAQAGAGPRGPGRHRPAVGPRERGTSYTNS